MKDSIAAGTISLLLLLLFSFSCIAFFIVFYFYGDMRVGAFLILLNFWGIWVSWKSYRVALIYGKPKEFGIKEELANDLRFKSSRIFHKAQEQNRFRGRTMLLCSIGIIVVLLFAWMSVPMVRTIQYYIPHYLLGV